MSELIQVGKFNTSLVMKGSKIYHVFVNERAKAEEKVKELNSNKLNYGWLNCSIEDVLTYGKLKLKNNRISVILSYDVPVIAYINNLYKAEADFSMLNKNLDCDYANYDIIRDVVIAND